MKDKNLNTEIDYWTIEDLQKSTAFIKNFFQNRPNEKLVYHNLVFTLLTLERAELFFKNENLNHKQQIIIRLSLLFANLGFLIDYDNPYQESIRIFEEYAEKENLNDSIVENTIPAIKSLVTQKPTDVTEQVLSDIYFLDFGVKKFERKSLLLKYEIQENSKREISDKEWSSILYKLISKHRFYSNYAINNYAQEKRNNLVRVLRDLEKVNKVERKEKTKAYYKQKYKDESPERSIQTLYRTALRNHIKLSDIADTKANILLSVNAIIISLVIANLVSKFNDPMYRYMILPTIIFVFFSVVSMMISIKATQPNVTRKQFTEEDIKNKKINLAFFGNFHKIEFERYQDAFNELIKKRGDVYNTLTKDLYFLGQVLDNKYRLLRYTYLVFMIGFVISIIAFTLSFIYRDSFTL